MTQPLQAPAALWPAMSIAQAHALMTAPGSPLEMAEVVIRGEPTRVWKNAPPTLREVFQASVAHGEATFLVHENERVSYAAFRRATLALAHALIAEGVGKGDRVAIIMRNLPEWPVAFFACVVIGAIATPLNAWWTGGELEYGLQNCGAKLAIFDAERFARVAEHLSTCPALSRVYVARGEAASAHPLVRPLEDVLGAVENWAALPEHALPEVAIEPEDDATIFYTSGTTGKPKGAVGSHRNSASTVLSAAVSTVRNCLRRGEAPPQPDPNAPQKAVLLSIPFFHTTGCQAVLIPTLAMGGKIVMMRRWEAERGMQLIAVERVTNAGGVPTIAWQLLEHPARANYDLSSIEVISYGGAPAASELVRRIKQVFPKTAPGQGWGMTETSATCTSISAEDYVERPDSCGPALPICDLKVMGPDGATLPVGAIGELCARGVNVVRGYWENPTATEATFGGGWLKTGDLARLDEEGFCFIVDRAKDMIIRGGENIYCIEVEGVLHQHPAVMDAALVAIPHRTLGEEPGAVVALKPGAQGGAADLQAFVAERLAAFKVPVRFVFSDELLPRNANGKIIKSELRKLFV